MEYISAKEFLKQPKEVQAVFKEWFIEQFEKSNDFDLFNYNSEDLCYKNILDRNCNFNVEDCIPLLTEGQIRKFIEDKTGCKIEIVWDGLDHDIYLVDKITGYLTIKDYINLGEDVLQAYWKVAIEIVKED